MADSHPPIARRAMPHALVMMLLIVTAAVALTYLIPAGEFTRAKGGLVVPGSFHTVASTPASPIMIVSSIPAGMVKSATLIFMILFIGGMFGVLQATGALEAGIERLLVATRGNARIVVPVVMIVLAMGSTFLGLISEYLIVIPIALLLAEWLGYDALFGTALVTIAAKIGYLTSVTNPLALAVAQPIVGVPVFSGLWFRAITFVVFLPIGIIYLLKRCRPGSAVQTAIGETSRLTLGQIAVLLTLLVAIVAMVYGVEELKWGNPELSAMYIGVALAIAVVGRVPSREASQAFIKGMQGLVLAAILVGLASAVEVILREGKILDSIVAFLTRSVEGKPPVIVANLMMLMQMVIDVFIPSTSGKAAVTMPILGPIGQLAGVSGQVTVQAFLFGNGLMNTLTPTSGMLLAYLATGKVSFSQWIRFILPLAALLFVLCLVSLTIAVLIGY
jgi:uncharacterized ion transporter superfamily protein YfcC